MIINVYIKKIELMLLFVFIIVSTIIMFPKGVEDKQQLRANVLTKQTTINGNVERIDYIDENGNIAFAADEGCATKIIISKGTSRIEHIYNEKGEPVSKYPGYYGLLKEYDEKGNNYHLSYLGIDDEPVITLFGYSDVYMQFYENGRIKKEKYYDTMGNPVCSPYYGYGLLKEYYEDDTVVKTTYLNDLDEAKLIGLGYAIIVQNMYKTKDMNRGKVESEYYYDEKEKPIALELGQYGVHREYNENGLESILLYLDKDGDPIITNKGYTSVEKTYYANNYVATEMYYDINGHPYALYDGQYGIKKQGNQTLYLGQNGEKIFNLKRLLYNHSWIIIPCTIIAILLSASVKRKGNIMLLFLYIGIIAYFTLMFRENVQSQSSELFGSYKRIFTDYYIQIDVLRNIWLFIPLGAILYKLHTKSLILLIPLCISVVIEGIQMLTNMGFCEFDDVISNSFGGYIGFVSCKLASDTVQRLKKHRLYTIMNKQNI